MTDVKGSVEESAGLLDGSNAMTNAGAASRAIDDLCQTDRPWPCLVFTVCLPYPEGYKSLSRDFDNSAEFS